MKIRILEDEELLTLKKRGHRAPSRTRKRRYIKRHLSQPRRLAIELDEPPIREYEKVNTL